MTIPLDAGIEIILSYLEALQTEELERERDIVRARKYHQGEHPTFMTSRMREFLNLTDEDEKIRMNVARQVVQAVAERLIVSGFDTTEEPEDEGEKTQAAWASEVWNKNRMESKQHQVHEGALRDGEFFVIVDWDSEKGYPRITPHPRFTSTEVEGDGYGCRLIYPDNNLDADPLFGLKEWVEIIPDKKNKMTTRRRRTFYYPDRVERYVYEKREWKPFSEEGEEAIIPWTKEGKPLGIAVKHFRNPDLRPEAWDALPLNDATNKLFIDLLAAADVTAFRIFVSLGFVPTTDGKPPETDGSNWLSLQPGQIVGTGRDATVTAFDAIEGADLGPLSDLVHQVILWTAMLTDTPLSRFISSKLVASAETLKQQEEPLDAKVDLRESLFGDAWEDVFTLCRMLWNEFGSQSEDEVLKAFGELDETIEFHTLWRQKRALTELTEKKGLGVPDEQLWKEAGYSPGQIEAMKSMDTYKTGYIEALWRAANNAVNSGIGLEGFLITAGFSEEEIAQLRPLLVEESESEDQEDQEDQSKELEEDLEK